MNLSIKYMGMELSSPLVAGASPLTPEIDVARALEDHGVSALVMHSLFEEQILLDEKSMHHHLTAHDEAHAEALSYFAAPVDGFALGPDTYLEQIARLKKAVDIPVIASINGVTRGGWTRFAKLMQDAGADALELNVYYLATDPNETAEAVEKRYTEVLAAVKESVTIPVAIKLSPFFSALVHTAKLLDAAGADAIVLFNRFYQPDIDIDELDVVASLELSDPSELRLRLRWLAALFGHVRCALAATGGVHSGRDAIKALMAGATVVQMTSAVMRHGPGVVDTVRKEMAAWMDEKEYESVEQMVGSMSLQRCPDPAAFERANYMKVLQSWRYGSLG